MALMARPILTAVIAVISLLSATIAVAQIAHTSFVIDNPKDFHRYALYCPKPEYPINLGERRIQGSGKFLLHIRSDGTVQSVETLTSTGNAELDEVAKNTFITWRFRPGPTAATIPIRFRSRAAGYWPLWR
jgi:TonB family protein